MSTAWFSVADLPDEVPIMVGQGGAGGQPISGAAQGQAGGDSWFGEFLLAPGGRGGKTQAASNQPRFPTLGGTYPEGGPGGAGAVRSGASVIPADDHVGMLSPTGGGMGEGSVVVGGGATDPGDLPVSIWAGRGGSGGLLLGAPPQPGQPGDLYGGGGGGGASTSGVLAQSFEGGDGAPGVVVVTVW